METKSINCSSCGAGIQKAVFGSSCVCNYCGNINIITGNRLPTINNTKTNIGTENGFKALTISQKIMIVSVVALMPMLLTRFIKK